MSEKKEKLKIRELTSKDHLNMIEKIKNLLFIYTCSIFSFLIPKKKGYLVFVPFFERKKFSGNIKALLSFAHVHYPNIDTALVTTNRKVANEVQRNGMTAIHQYFAIFWAVLRAEHLIIDASTVFFSRGKFSIIQLWHGTGFKNVGLLNDHITDAMRSHLIRLWNKFKLVITTSKEEAKKLNESFGTDCAIITGSPRNDLFFEEEDFKSKVRKTYGVAHYQRIITYAPTFRDYETAAPFSEEFWQKLNCYLATNNVLFIATSHPLDRYFKIPHQYSNIVDWSGTIRDVQELLLITDLLISDYSSIVTDYVLTGKPILTYAYDFELFKHKCRSIYYDLSSILPQPFIKKEEELLEKIRDDHWFRKPEIQASYTNFRDTFHYYLDGHSGRRVMEAIINLS